MIRLALAALLLTGCAASGEVVDQTGHYAMGRSMAAELRDNTRGTDKQIEALIMQYAEGRERLQHSGACGENCRLDLEWWRSGVRAALR